jgi:signal transduction histidine kinase
LWLALATLAAALLVAWVVAEGRRERTAVEASLAGQARLLAQALGPALASASAAERELLELLTWKLLDNARLLGELEAAGRLDLEEAAELLEPNGLTALWRLGADGSPVWEAGSPVARAAGAAERASLESAAAGAVRGAGDEWVLEAGGPAGGGLIAAGVRTHDGGGLFTAAAPGESFAFARRIGVDSALRELVTTPAVLYLRYREDPAGLEAEAAWDGGPVPVAAPNGELRGRPCFEVDVPVAAPAGRSASLRVGLDGAPLSAAGVAALRRTTLAAIVLAVVGILSLAAALTERGRARERDALRRRLAAAEGERQRGERLAAAGALAAGLAHEVRNPLNAIGLAAQRIERLVAREPRRHPPLLALTARIRDEVARLERSLRGFLDLARPAVGERRALDLAALAGEVLAGLELEAEARRVSWRARLEPATAVVEPESVRRALVNLVRNALEASPPGSEVEVETGAVPMGANGDGPGWVRLAVRDRGPGLPAELGERAFEAFVTTKAEGTGLGLAIVHQVVAEHRGRSFLQPREGGGAEAVLELPRGEAA